MIVNLRRIHIEKVKPIVVILICIAFHTLQAQNDFQSTDLVSQYKSPESASLGKYVSLPMNLNTGTPNITIPIYTIQYGGMELPMTLTYDASGVKVEDISSPVGLKWSLNIGGAILRMVRGTYDEGNSYSVATSGAGTRGYYLSNGLSWLRENSETFYGNTSNLGTYMNDVASGQLDTQPDIFAYNYLGHKGKFFFDENGNTIHQNKSDFKIDEVFTLQPRTRFSEWNIISDDGMVAKFGGSNSAIESFYSAGVGQYTNHWQDNSWFLTELANPKTNRKIILQYTKNEYINGTISNMSDYTCFNTTSYLNGSICYAEKEEIYCSLAMTASIPKLNQTNYSVPIIDKIIAGRTEIIFVKSYRNDLFGYLSSSNAQKIDEIQILYDNICVKKFRFNYDYFISEEEPVEKNLFGNDLAETSKYRLKLLSFAEVACDDSDSIEYIFRYDENHALPPRISYSKDHWGYYNGKNDNESLFPNLYPYYDVCNDSDFFGDRSVDEAYLKAGTLKKIIYPTKGSVEFEYEPHLNDEPILPIIQGGWINDKILSSGGEIPQESPFINEVQYTFTYDAEYKLTGSLIGWTSWGPQCVPASSSNHAIEIFNAQGENIFWYSYGNVDEDNTNDGMENININFVDTPLQRGDTYTIKVYGLSNSQNEMCYYTNLYLQKFDFTISENNSPNYKVGGLRVKQLIFKDLNDEIIRKSDYEYDNPTLIYKPEYIYSLEWDANKPIEGLNYFGYFTDEAMAEWFEIYKTGNFLFLTTTNPYNVDFTDSHISYNKVIEKNGLGSEEYYFQPPKTYQELNGFSGTSQIPIMPLVQSQLAGKLLTQSTYDMYDNLVRKSRNYYRTVSGLRNTVGFNVSTTGTTPGIGFEYYELGSEDLYLDSTVVYENFSNREITKVQKYFYESENHNQITRREQVGSNDKTIIESMAYPSDIVNPNLSELSLISENRLSEVLKKEKFIDNQHIETTTVEYKIENGLTLPSLIKKQIGDGAEFIQSSFDKYDQRGNLLQLSKMDGSIISYLWGYDQTLPVAELVNTRFSEIESVPEFGLDFHAGIYGLTDSQNNTLRSALPNSQVTTFSHKPLVGLVEKIDLNGLTRSYEHDGLLRIKNIKYQDKVVQSLSFHYSDKHNP